jgi:hypothetical protein
VSALSGILAIQLLDASCCGRPTCRFNGLVFKDQYLELSTQVPS